MPGAALTPPVPPRTPEAATVLTPSVDGKPRLPQLRLFVIVTSQEGEAQTQPVSPSATLPVAGRGRRRPGWRCGRQKRTQTWVQGRVQAKQAMSTQGGCSVLLTRLRGAHPPWDFLPAVCPSVTLWLMFPVAPKSAIAVLLMGHVSYITWHWEKWRVVCAPVPPTVDTTSPK